LFFREGSFRRGRRVTLPGAENPPLTPFAREKQKMLDLDPFPHVVAGVQSVRCTACWWEKVYVMPEEANKQIGDLLLHLQVAHGIVSPVFECTQY
jgi:hypothetical protein